MSDQLQTQSALRKTPVAIVGLSGIFPQAENLQEYWDNIVKEVDSITDVPASRWKIEDYYDPDPAAPDKTYCKRGGFMPDIEFNPMEFGLPPNILEVTDASQLLSLVVAKAAMNDAGYGQDTDFDRNRTGVVLGVGGGQKLITPLTSRLQYPIWDRVLESSGIAEEDRTQIIEKMKKAYIRWEENSFPGMLGNVISGRVANRLDLGGMNCVVDAACAASLAAVKLAVTELTDHRADMMITGGVDTDNSIFMYMSFSKTPAFSKNNDIRPFDAGSDGMMIGEAVGMLVLKRLEDAERDGDRVYAVIKGIGTSSDGRYKSIYAPRSSGQALAVNRAYEDAGFSPTTVSLVEAHGTGTPAGDPAEFAGLVEVFAHNNPNKQHIALGSVKSQIGHTKAAAGAASLIKTALALHHRVLPPTLNVERPNPKMDIENSPFYVNTHSRPWLPLANGLPRRAGVSAFGFGGTNFHFALEEYNGEPTGEYRLHKTPEDIFIKAPNPAQLVEKCESELIALQSEEGETHFRELVLQSKSPNIPLASARLGFVADDREQAIEFLETAVKLLKSNPAPNWEHPKGIFYRENGIATKGKVVALFPGQGSQYLEMGKELALNFPPIRDAYGDMDALFVNDGQAPLSDILFPIPVFTPEEKQAQSDTLRRTEFVQPSIGAFSVGLYKLLKNAGFQPDFAAGHSFGELTALWAGGVLDDETYFFLAKARGQAMAAPGGPSFDTGTMVAVKGDTNQLQQDIQALAGVTIANYNSNEQVVLAGSEPAMQAAQTYLGDKGYVVTPLPVSAAFHTNFVGHAQEPFAQAISKVPFSAPRIAVYSNSSGQPYNSQPDAIKATLKDHILNPVLFRQEIENIYAAGGAIFVEIGPKRVLTNLVKNILGDRPHIAIPVNASRSKGSDRQLHEAFVQLCVAGVPLKTLDPYRREFSAPTAEKKSMINVQLSGNNYVSPKTKEAYDKALAEGKQLSVSGGHSSVNSGHSSVNSKQLAVNSEPVAVKVPVKAEVVKAVAPAPVQAPKPVAKPVVPAAAPLPPPNKPKVEAKSVPVSKPVSQKANLTNGVTTNGRFHTPPPAPAPKSESKVNKTMSQSSAFQKQVEKSLNMLHEHQAETARVHETFLKGQETYVQSVVQLLQQMQKPVSSEPLAVNQEPVVAPSAPAPAPTPVVPQPVTKVEPVAAPPVPVAPDPVKVGSVVETVNYQRPTDTAHQSPPPNPQAPTLDITALSNDMLVIVSEKTGYPVEMLELSMDMESDLGIDSIKRVEILGAMQEQHPELPEVNPAELAELRTLQQIVDHLSVSVSGNQLTVNSQQSTDNGQRITDTAPQPPTLSPQSPDLDITALSNDMLIIVSEKTGYPVEMLELSMDMESDLGIDFIKRVEILGAMQEQHPELPEVNPAELAELRTLQQIVDHLSVSVNSDQLTVNSQHSTDNGQRITDNAPQSLVPTPQSPAFDVTALSNDMLVIVSEKTGYPVEMLELSMDMESDLGIDSIKRVEILGAMQEQHPELPEVNPAELAELRTLQQIVDHLSESLTGEPAKKLVRL